MAASAPLYSSARVSVTTYNEYLKRETDMTIRKNPFLAALQEKKRITLGWNKRGGEEIVWNVRYRGMEPEVGEDLSVISSPRENLWKQCKIQWRRYFKGQSISKFEKLIGGGSNSLIKIVDKLYPAQVKSIMDRLAKDIWNNDGNSTSGDCQKRVHGFPSWMGGTGSVVTDNGVGGLVEDPNDYYAGLYTALQYYGGSWTPTTGGEWPTGSGDYEYHFFSPMKVHVGSSKLTNNSTHNWYTQWQAALNFAITYHYAHRGEKWDAFFVSPEALRQAKDSLQGDSSLFITRGPGESTLVKLGFSPLSYEGVDLVPDHNITAANVKGYGVQFDKLELRALQDQLIEKDTDTDITVSADIIVADCFVNLAIESPAYSCAFVDGITEP